MILLGMHHYLSVWKDGFQVKKKYFSLIEGDGHGDMQKYVIKSMNLTPLLLGM